jgi:GT2 family glycosyltransferase
MRIVAGVLHYRFWPRVRETLDGLLAQTRQPDQVVVMDHASGDGSSARIRAAYPELEVLELPENRGPTAGMNQLLRALLARSADAVFILTDDLRLAPDALQQLAARMEEEPTLGAAGPLIALQESPDRVFYAGGYVRRHNWSLDFRGVPEVVSGWRGEAPHLVDFLELGGILIRTEAARAAGFLPERFYYWADDVDYTLRIGSLGWRLECVPTAVGWQELGYPPPYLATRNTLGLIARNAPRRFLARELVRTVYWLIRDTIRPPEGTRADIWLRFRGLLDFCLNRWGPPPGNAS